MEFLATCDVCRELIWTQTQWPAEPVTLENSVLEEDTFGPNGMNGLDKFPLTVLLETLHKSVQVGLWMEKLSTVVTIIFSTIWSLFWNFGFSLWCLDTFDSNIKFLPKRITMDCGSSLMILVGSSDPMQTGQLTPKTSPLVITPFNGSITRIVH